MKYFEIILKLTFLILSIFCGLTAKYLFWGDEFIAVVPWMLLPLVSIILGIVLFSNKKTSYSFPATQKDYVIRKIEGVILILAPIYFFLWMFQ